MTSVLARQAPQCPARGVNVGKDALQEQTQSRKDASPNPASSRLAPCVGINGYYEYENSKGTSGMVKCDQKHCHHDEEDDIGQAGERRRRLHFWMDHGFYCRYHEECQDDGSKERQPKGVMSLVSLYEHLNADAEFRQLCPFPEDPEALQTMWIGCLEMKGIKNWFSKKSRNPGDEEFSIWKGQIRLLTVIRQANEEVRLAQRQLRFEIIAQAEANKARRQAELEALKARRAERLRQARLASGESPTNGPWSHVQARETPSARPPLLSQVPRLFEDKDSPEAMRRRSLIAKMRQAWKRAALARYQLYAWIPAGVSNSGSTAPLPPHLQQLIADSTQPETGERVAKQGGSASLRPYSSLPPAQQQEIRAKLLTQLRRIAPSQHGTLAQKDAEWTDTMNGIAPGSAQTSTKISTRPGNHQELSTSSRVAFTSHSGGPESEPKSHIPYRSPANVVGRHVTGTEFNTHTPVNRTVRLARM